MSDQEKTLWPRARLAHRLSITIEVFYRTRRDLEAKGLPDPVFGKGKGERWDPDEVENWLKQRRTSNAPADPQAPAEPDYGSILDARAAALAQGGRA